MTFAYAYSYILAVPLALAACGPKQPGEEDTAPATDTGTDASATSANATEPTPTDTGDAPVTPTGSGSGDPGTLTDDASGPCADASPLIAITKLAYTADNVPEGEDPTVGPEGLTTGPSELEPGTVILLFSNQAYTCDDPQAELVCQNVSSSLLIPPEFQAPGVYELNDSDFRGFYADTAVFDNTGGPECGGGAGSVYGTLVIDSFDATGITGRLCRSTADEAPPPFEGIFSASRCP